MADKPFNVVISLVKTQIRSERRLNTSDIGRCIPALSILIGKYDWIPPLSSAFPARQYPPISAAGPQKQMIRASPVPTGALQRASGIEQSPTVPTAKHSQGTPPIRVQQQRQPAKASVPPELPNEENEDDNRVPCLYCGRKFAADRIDKHQNVCPQHPDKLAKSEKRGQLNMTAKRLADLQPPPSKKRR
ncbi:C2HC-type zinc-finger domain-containing protein [Giardia muris]|uniref:C2HC-type zinc-finger domain-containing protein n=1 Tax=Giardia muris TaxID=5742 RepID=A0A4Z1T4N5_GIAMU|nr:C2HC-type zinc-finger domain-containing protein [Giardia muris]|eukprot:TNJ27401.1 C2HC-type zinc-finger domain-containing protein [Giardia muris]